MDKYYTPEIEEFHVGFECEIKNYSNLTQFEWEKAIFLDDFSNNLEQDYCFEFLYADLRDDNIRVKFLDREDIESLEFIFNGNERGKFRFIRGNIVIIFCPDTYIVQIIIEPIERRFNYVIPRGFCGTIKNISELKQIIKMLKLGQYWM